MPWGSAGTQGLIQLSSLDRRLFARMGAGFDIVSGGELARVLASPPPAAEFDVDQDGTPSLFDLYVTVARNLAHVRLQRGEARVVDRAAVPAPHRGILDAAAAEATATTRPCRGAGRGAELPQDRQ